MKRLIHIVLLFMITHNLISQVYIEKKSRHRFAQLNLGIDIQTNYGGTSSYVDIQGNVQSINIKSGIAPRFLIGGTHFWGHADFYIGIPLYERGFKEENLEITALRGVETVFKYYPIRIKHNTLRPYIGISLAPFYYEQNNLNLDFPSGPELNHTSFPVLGGLSYNSSSHLFELGIAYNYQNKQDYYIARDKIAKVTTPPIYATLSYRYMLETTLSAEEDWESGKTKEITQILAEKKRLNGIYVGVGISSAFWLKQSDYNKELRPYISKPSTSIMADFTVGYYLHNPDLNFAVAYRGYKSATNTYGSVQQLRRQSMLCEVTKYLFDYHGFVPFLGPAISYEKLYFKEDYEGSNTVNEENRKVAYGLTFGWDIRPNRIQSWLLRTNLRWFPNLNLDFDDSSTVSFDNLEFNFIQLIIYPSRLLK